MIRMTIQYRMSLEMLFDKLSKTSCVKCVKDWPYKNVEESDWFNDNGQMP